MQRWAGSTCMAPAPPEAQNASKICSVNRRDGLPDRFPGERTRMKLAGETPAVSPAGADALH